MRDFWLDPHTWVSTVPDSLFRKLECDADRTEELLTRIGRDKWIDALLDEAVRLPNFRRLSDFEAFVARELSDEELFAVAIVCTRIMVAQKLNDQTRNMFGRIGGPTPFKDLQNTAEYAMDCVTRYRWAIIPFDEEGRFELDRLNPEYDSLKPFIDEAKRRMEAWVAEQESRRATASAGVFAPSSPRPLTPR